ncbi:hypothetical protein H6P81_017009 [Aristolochia fimbriata]|uniref:Pentatricopeptide repeat-containing protein n=1 Tax=Aristolochia fimbriata TaxID=158543 RepID=A0AAV7DWX3_ARIFI|nr:hypothetical protein H6P81_017009 [Aristolochia fimbriata]
MESHGVPLALFIAFSLLWLCGCARIGHEHSSKTSLYWCLSPAFLRSVTSPWSLGFRTVGEARLIGDAYSHLLRSYSDVPLIRQVHARIISEGISRDSYFATHLVKSYAKAGSYEAARQVFELVPEQNVFLFNAIIRAYSVKESWSEIAELYRRMEKRRVKPDGFTLPFVIKAFSSLWLEEEGQRVHETAERMELLGNVHVATALIDMYLKFDELEPAMEIFDKMPERDVVSCTSVVTGCVRMGKYEQAFRIFRMMRLGDHKPNWVTVLGLLPACDCSNIHGFVIKFGFDFWVEVQTALLDMYAKYGNILLAQEIFDQIQEKSVVSWTAMVSAYCQNNYVHEALEVFRQMLRSSDFRPDAIVAASVLQACAQLGTLNCGEIVHGYNLKNGLASNLLSETALLDMYAKCGSITAAETVFNGMNDSGMISWSAMIAGYGFHGLGLEALNLFQKMNRVGFVPDETSFLSVLSACSHSGLVSEGKECFDLMLQSNHVTPNTKHYACMVDLFGRAGLLDEASTLVKGMPVEPDVNVWAALLCASRGTRRIDLAEFACNKLVQLDSENTEYHVLLANVFAACGRWEDVSKVRTTIRQKGDGKMPGWSLVEVSSKLYAFLAEDTSHPDATNIYALLLTLHIIARDRDVDVWL